jgi:uncharacterized protein YbaR (Trm112 family)
MTVPPLTEDDLRWLVCPVCHQSLTIVLNVPAIQCCGCYRLYPIVDSLPILLASRAKLAYELL